ncbi:MAG: LPXTG cell wall anchor domain-containing protein, partial [Firmicutes bacterium]|nr:LPXTG cell wall anchor domain-containing protein [Bacillota bacterium]
EPPVKTGDTTVVVPYIVIGVAALILLLMLLFRTRKNRA